MASRGETGVLICEDHNVLADALGLMLATDPDLDLVAPPVSDPFDAIELTSRLKPTVVLMDIDLGAEIDGIEATRRIKASSPETHVLLMTAMQDEALVVKAVEAGAAGLLRKTQTAELVLEAIKRVAAGEILVDPKQLTRVLRALAAEREQRREADLLLGQLTDREREILQLLAEGRGVDEMAAALVLSPSTVQTHVRNILSKLGVSSRLEAVVFAARHGAVRVG